MKVAKIGLLIGAMMVSFSSYAAETASIIAQSAAKAACDQSIHKDVVKTITDNATGHKVNYTNFLGESGKKETIVSFSVLGDNEDVAIGYAVANCEPLSIKESGELKKAEKCTNYMCKPGGGGFDTFNSELLSKAHKEKKNPSN